ncbi:hypothetical protein AURDEDRAFT_169228, partial [Auricularia subglabra TFB-10046 SS5]
MPLEIVCALTGHDVPFLFNAADGDSADLDDPTIQDLLEDVAEYHEFHCACDIAVGSRVWAVPVPLPDAALSPHDYLAANPLPLDTRLQSLVPAQSRLLVLGEDCGPNEFLRQARSKKFVSYTVDDGAVLKRLGAQPLLPDKTSPSYTTMCSTPGSVFVDKSAFVHTLISKLTLSFVSVIRRPPGFGKTTLLSMLGTFFDVYPTCAHFPFIFDEATAREPAFQVRRQLLVFSVDLAELSMTGDWTPGGDAMWDGCRALLDDAANKFYNRYHEVLRAPEAETARPDFSATFQEVLHWSRVQGYDWCFLIDNYTTPY